MKYMRLRYDGEDDIEYDNIVIFQRDYSEKKIENAMRELWNAPKIINVEEWLNYKNLKVKEIVLLNKIQVMYVR